MKTRSTLKREREESAAGDSKGVGTKSTPRKTSKKTPPSSSPFTEDAINAFLILDGRLGCTVNSDSGGWTELLHDVQAGVQHCPELASMVTDKGYSLLHYIIRRFPAADEDTSEEMMELQLNAIKFLIEHI
jgi:hypothetical protein